MLQLDASAIDTVLFDLDGTLLDTAEDMGNALNALLKKHQRPPLPLPQIRPYVSKGGMALITLGFALNPESSQASLAETLRLEFLDLYAQNISTHTRLFPGIPDLLHHIETSHRTWGIVTNKPAFLTQPLLRNLNLHTRPACIISGDTLPQRKPDPEPLLHACQLSNSTPPRTIYIGDDQRDIQAGQRAGIPTIAAAYGYILPSDDPKNWGANAIVNHPEEIHHWLQNANP